MTDVNAENVEDIKAQPQAQTFPDHWSLFLHCTICFGFFHNPHTLECGHSFCKRCLKRLAEISRDDNPDIRLRRLCVSCPTCRHPFRAKPAVKGRLRTCILLKHLVDLWMQECKMLLSTPPRHLRSICSQTEGDTCDNTKSTNRDQKPLTIPHAPGFNLQEEFLIRLPPGDDYFEAVMKQVSEASSEIEHDQNNEKVSDGLHPAGNPTDPDRSRETNSSSSDSESSASSSSDEIALGGIRGAGNGGGVLGDGGAVAARQTASSVSIPEFLGQLSVSASLFRSCEWFPVRYLLITVWFIYSLLIVALAEAFLPYVMIFTLFFFLIVLK